MRTADSRWIARRVVPFILVIPLIVVPTVALLVALGGGSTTVPVAAGSAGGAFHPVAGNFVADATDLSECSGSYGCLEQAFGNISYRSGPRPALALFEKMIDTDAAVERDCHRIVHMIGSAAYARFDGDIARTFAAGSSICASGYYHGILERAFVGLNTKAELGAAARSLCLGVGIRRRGFLDYQCRHGLGHGFMIQTGYDLPTALSLCHSLGTGWDEVTCTSGSFMENVSTRFGFRSSWLDESDLLYPCNRVQRRYRRSCYVRATTWILQVNGNDFGDAARVCASAGKTWASACFRGYGRDAVVDARYADTSKVLRRCAAVGRYLGDCLYGAARTFSDGGAQMGVRQAAALCTRAPAVGRRPCASGLGIVLGLLYSTDEARRAVCRRYAPAEADSCASAAIAEVDPRGLRSWG